MCIRELHESAASRERAVLHRDALRGIECTNLSQRPLRQRSRVSVPSAHLLTAAEELTRANRPAQLDLKPRQRLLTGKLYGDIDRPELAGQRHPPRRSELPLSIVLRASRREGPLRIVDRSRVAADRAALPDPEQSCESAQSGRTTYSNLQTFKLAWSPFRNPAAARPPHSMPVPMPAPRERWSPRRTADR
jgi:hypothetical protein